MCQGPLTIWNPSTGKLLYTLGKYEGGVVAPLAFSPNGKLLACAFQSVEMGESVEPASLPGRIDIWDPHTRKLAKTLEFSNRAPFIVFFPDNKLLAFAKDENGVRLWNVLTGEHIQTFEGDEAQTICSPAFHPDGEVFASGSGDHKIRFWSVQTGKCLHTLKTSLPVDSVAFSPDGTKLVSAAGGAVILWGVPDDK
jgi:WD40 repeat protein